ncbi:hypothetical protein AB1E18_006803 [Capra hircus]
MMRLPPSAPPGLEATLMPDPGPGEVPVEATALSPALPEFVEPPFRQAPIPAMEIPVNVPRIPPQLDLLDWIEPAPPALEGEVVITGPPAGTILAPLPGIDLASSALEVC